MKTGGGPMFMTSDQQPTAFGWIEAIIMPTLAHSRSLSQPQFSGGQLVRPFSSLRELGNPWGLFMLLFLTRSCASRPLSLHDPHSASVRPFRMSNDIHSSWRPCAGVGDSILRFNGRIAQDPASPPHLASLSRRNALPFFTVFR